MRYAYKVFEELFYNPNKYNDPIHFNDINTCIKYKIENVDYDGFYYGKSEKEILNHFQQIIDYLVNDLKVFHIYYLGKIDHKILKNFNELLLFCKKNNIDLFDFEALNFHFCLIKTQQEVNIPKTIPQNIHDIFEPYLFCELPKS